MVLCQLCIPGDKGRLEALGDQGCVDAACALHMNALQTLVDVCQHLCAQRSVAGLGLESIQLSESQSVQRTRRGGLSSMEVEGPCPEQVPNLPQAMTTLPDAESMTTIPDAAAMTILPDAL